MIKEPAVAVTADLGQFFDREREDTSLIDILNAPVSASQGVSEGDAEALRAAFNVKTVADLEDVPSSVELRWRSGELQAALTC